MEVRTKHLGASFEAGFESGLEGLKAMEIGAKQYQKEGALVGPQNLRKSRRAKMGLPSSRFQSQLLLVNQLQLEINASTDLPQWRGQNRGPLLISKGVHFSPLFQHISFARGSKTRPSTVSPLMLCGTVLCAWNHRMQDHANPKTH